MESNSQVIFDTQLRAMCSKRDNHYSQEENATQKGVQKKKAAKPKKEIVLFKGIPKMPKKQIDMVFLHPGEEEQQQHCMYNNTNPLYSGNYVTFQSPAK